MTAPQALETGAKLLGVWLIVDALRSLATAFPFALGQEEQTLLHHLTAPPAQALVQALLALALIWRAPILAPRLGEADFLGAGLLLIALSTAIISFAELLSLLFMPPGTVPWRIAIEPLVGLLLGFALFAWARSPARL